MTATTAVVNAWSQSWYMVRIDTLDLPSRMMRTYTDGLGPSLGHLATRGFGFCIKLLTFQLEKT